MMTDTSVEYVRLGSDTCSIQRMEELNAMFAIAFEDEEHYAHHLPSKEHLAHFLSNQNHVVCVALAGDDVVGGLVAYVLEKFEQERSEVYIYDLAVLETYRRKKIATNLIRLLQKEVADTNAWVIFVQADPVDKPAVKLYESLGIREDVYHFDIPVAKKDQKN